MLRIPLFAALAIGALSSARGADPVPPPPSASSAVAAPTASSTEVPEARWGQRAPPSPAPAVSTVAAAAVAPGADLSLLPLTLPGYELRVLDQRKTLTYAAAGTQFEVHLPIFFYLPSPELSESLQMLRQAVDELRHAAHEPDRNEYDFEKLLARFEQGLGALGPR